MILTICCYIFITCTKNHQKRCENYKTYNAYKNIFEFEDGVKPKRASGTRWISHKLEALKLLLDKLYLYNTSKIRVRMRRTKQMTEQSLRDGYVNGDVIDIHC